MNTLFTRSFFKFVSGFLLIVVGTLLVILGVQMTAGNTQQANTPEPTATTTRN